MKPLVSILIPAYNAEAWLVDTVQSALAQTWERKEIIIVDDGSRDQTLAIARRFASAGVNVKTQKNQGAAAARNKALSLAQGDYIQWLDADDLLSSGKIASQMRVVQAGLSPHTLLSSGWGYFIYRPSKARFVPSLLWNDLTPIEWLVRKWENNLHMQTATWLVNRQLAAVAGPWNDRLLGDDDGEYFFRVIKASDGIKFVPGGMVFYRISGSNRLSYIGRSDEKKEAQCAGMELQIGYLRSMEDSERVRAACVKYLQTWLLSFYPERPDLVERMCAIATSLGGELQAPALSWKYAWIQRLFGWSAAKHAQMSYNLWKAALLRSLDYILYQFERDDDSLDRDDRDRRRSLEALK